jgi:hypothetical protein
MKPNYKLLLERYPKIVAGTFIMILITCIMSFIAFDKKSTEADTTTSDITSISVVDEKYKIDTNIAITNWNKERLVTKLETENLIDKKTVSEIPVFIKMFLDGISPSKTFDIANPDEEWHDGGWVNGFDKEQKTIAQAISAVAKPCPNKQLIYCGIGEHTALISYYIGGIKKMQSNMIIKFKNEKIVGLWFDHYYSQFGYSLGGTTDFVTTKAGIINYIKNTKSGGC